MKRRSEPPVREVRHAQRGRHALESRMPAQRSIMESVQSEADGTDLAFQPVRNVVEVKA